MNQVEKDRAQGVVAERARLKAILFNDAAANKKQLAEYLAFDTDMAPDAAIALLTKAAVEKPIRRLAVLMAGVGNPRIGMDFDLPADGHARAPRRTSAEIYAQRRRKK